MIILLAVVLGIIQALTEFLPISSSGHLLLARAAMDFDMVDGLTFDVAVHVGTLAAIVLYFHRDIAAVIRGFVHSITKRDPKDLEQRLAWDVIIACIPAGIVGYFFETQIENWFRHPAVVVVTLTLGALLFFAVEKWTKPTLTAEKMTLGSALFMGTMQTLALIPGVSRSGITICSGMMRGYRREEAARFSFVMASPLLAGAGLKKGLDMVGQPLPDGELTLLFVGLATSAIAGWLVIRFLIAFLRKYRLNGFAWYRLALAAAVAVYLWM